jgi:hypothetical protein
VSRDIKRRATPVHKKPATTADSYPSIRKCKDGYEDGQSAVLSFALLKMRQIVSGEA